MNLKEYREIAIDSAEAYLKYLKDSETKGKEIITAKEIIPEQNNKFKLMLDKKAVHTDYIKLKIKAIPFTLDEKELKKIVSIVCFNDAPASAIVKVKEEFCEAFKNLPPDSITFVSDFTFLIEAVKQWYYDHSKKITTPSRIFDVEYSAVENVTITESQLSAIDSALASDISYVWGAPGTGKTQYVLANCIMEYVKSGQKVLLMAPTNNALEQSARGILQVFEENEIPSSHLYRLGNPSLSFALKYPEVCHSTASDFKIKRLKDEIAELSKENADYIEFQSLQNNFAQFKYLRAEYREIEKRQTEYMTKLGDAEESKSLFETKLKKLKIDLDSENTHYAELYHKRNSLFGKIKCLFSDTHKNDLIFKLSESLKNSDAINNQIDQHLNLISEKRQEIADINKGIKNTKNELKNCYEKIVPLAPLAFDILTDINEIHDAFENALKKYENIEFDETIPELIKQKQDELDIYLQEQKVDLTDRYIIACTVDYAFLHYEDFPQDVDKDAVHLFVDEAAYCPMIKAGLFFSYGIPVTFLGDHMQLPPICEMTEVQVKQSMHNAFLWSQSATFFPEIFLQESTINSIRERFLKNKELNPINMKVSSLSETHRFGNNLAAILDKFVYKFGFTGIEDSETKITVINAPKVTRAEKPRINLEEINAIYHYVKSRGLTPDKYAILTPYRDQVYAIKKRLGNRAEITTVHASQGREWDTVIFSVADVNNMFLTDSTNPESNGLRIINTAISRAKKELVIVLDYDHWQYKSDYQLIANIAVNNTEYIEADTLISITS